MFPPLGVGEHSTHIAWNALRERLLRFDDVDNPTLWTTLGQLGKSNPKDWPKWFVDVLSEMLDADPWDIYVQNMHDTYAATDALLHDMIGNVSDERIESESSQVKAVVLNNREVGAMLIDVRTGTSGVGYRHWAVRGRNENKNEE